MLYSLVRTVARLGMDYKVKIAPERIARINWNTHLLEPP